MAWQVRVFQRSSTYALGRPVRKFGAPSRKYRTPKEREQFLAAFEPSINDEHARGCPRFSLSPQEGVGVWQKGFCMPMQTTSRLAIAGLGRKSSRNLGERVSSALTFCLLAALICQ